MDFNVTAQEIAVVVTPEPTSLTDAYALMKVLSIKYGEKHCKLIVNLAASKQEGHEIYRQLDMVASRFLDISIDYLGCIFYDEKLTQCVKRQKIIGQAYPSTRASRCFYALAKTISDSSTAKIPRGNSNFFWNHLVQNKFA
jgi:flagellar biosynthesis protein FlhG